MTNIRCPVYGFVSLEAWQRGIVDHAACQRLRRIRQLGMAEWVYPSLTHTRFEHSLGTMHMASRMFDGIRMRGGEWLAGALGCNDSDLDRMRRVVQAAALLHDVGHGPLSHVCEPLLAGSGNRQTRSHEAYSAAIIRSKFRDVIDRHPDNRDFAVTAEEVAEFLLGENLDPAARFWRGILVGQVDADRMDYLIRDSLHSGVAYGRYDWPRLLLTVVALQGKDGRPVIGIDEGGWHAAEAMILSRYAIFTQVYFHHTVVALEHDLHAALRQMLPRGHFPAPKPAEIDAFLAWDDWRVFGALSAGEGGESGERIRTRRPHVQVYGSPETPGESDLQVLERVERALGPLCVARHDARESSWYRPGADDVQIRSASGKSRPLSEYSAPVRALRPHRQVRLYARRKDRAEAAGRVAAALAETEGAG